MKIKKSSKKEVGIKTIDSLFYYELGMRLCELRHSRKIVLNDIAKMVGCSKQNIDLMELGKRKISVSDFERIKKELGFRKINIKVELVD